MNPKSNNNDKNLSNIKVQLSNIESFLMKSNYFFINNNCKIKSYIESINQILTKKDYLSNFEFNEKITFSEVSVKYGTLIQSINKIFSSDLTIEDMYEQYIDFTKDNIMLNQYLNSLIIIILFFSNFIDSNINIINYDQIEIYDVSDLDEDKNEIKNKLNLIYTKYKENSTFKGNKININLIILILFCTMGNSYYIDKNIPDLNNLMKFIVKYNNNYVNNLNISLFLYFNCIIFVNLYLNSIKYKKQFLNYEKQINNNNLIYIEFNENDNLNENNLDKLNSQIYTLYLYDNENIIFNSENNAVKLLLFQNYLKLYSLFNFSKIKMKCTINLYIETMYDLLSQIKNIKKEGKESLEENIFNSIEDNISELNLSKINLFQKDNVVNIFNNFNFLNLSIFVTGYINDFQISKNIANNLNLIKKSKSIFIQESSLFNKNVNVGESPIEKFLECFTILHYILETFCKNFNSQKNYPNLFSIKFNFFKCTINRNKKKEEIKIFFDYSCIKEKSLFHFFRSSENINFIINKYIEIISLLHKMRIANCVIRISQTNFISRQLSFYFKLIIKSIIDFIEFNKYPNIEIYEKKLPNYNPNMLVYIKDSSQSKKMNFYQLKLIFNHPLYFQKIKLFQYYLEQIESNFDIVVISDNIKEFQLLRIYDDNKLFIFLNKESPDNIEIEKAKGTLTNSLIETYEYLNIFLYFKNDQEIYKKGMNLLSSLKKLRQTSKENVILPYKTTLICDRFFIESKIIVDKTMENYIFSLYDTVDELLLIAKLINESSSDNFNYDIFINKKYINVLNYHKYDYKNDIKCENLIHDFISTISSCIELIIYILKYKEIIIDKFIYIVRTLNDEYFSFEYKDTNIFFKKLKEFESLIIPNFKKSFPLLCLLSNKKETDYTESNSNFCDVFLRLFLNLNKVSENKDKLLQLFLQKLHKSIFYQYYENFELIGFNYQAINFFNEFLSNNEYIKISEGDKFDKCTIVPIHVLNTTEKNNYKKMIKDFIEKKENSLFNKISIFNYGFDNSYIYKNFENVQMGFSKIEYFCNIQNGLINSELNEEFDKKKKFLFKRIKSGKFNKKIFSNIISFIKNGNIMTFNSNINLYEESLKEYKKERLKYKSQNVGKRIYQITEIAKLGGSINANNNCIIY